MAAHQPWRPALPIFLRIPLHRQSTVKTAVASWLRARKSSGGAAAGTSLNQLPFVHQGTETVAYASRKIVRGVRSGTPQRGCREYLRSIATPVNRSTAAGRAGGNKGATSATQDPARGPLDRGPLVAGVSSGVEASAQPPADRDASCAHRAQSEAPIRHINPPPGHRSN